MEASPSDVAPKSPAEGVAAAPISPELVLVDPELAAAARASLSVEAPEVRGGPSHRPDRVPLAAVAELGPSRDADEDRWEYGPSRRRRWVRGAVVFVGGCALVAAAAFYGNGLVAIEPAIDAVVEPPASKSAEPANEPVPPVISPRPRRRSAAAKREQGKHAGQTRPLKPPAPAPKRAAPSPPRRRPNNPAPRSTGSSARRPSNVLGVVVSVRGRAVVLEWQRPKAARGVMIRRRPGRGSSESTVYEGNGTSYADRTVRKGVTYHYLIITKGRQGNLSTGVAAVVKPGVAT